MKKAWLLRHLPSESVLAGNDGWSIGDFLAADLVHVQSGTPHPLDPRVIRAAKARRQVLEQGASRAAARRASLGIRGSVLRKSAGRDPV